MFDPGWLLFFIPALLAELLPWLKPVRFSISSFPFIFAVYLLWGPWPAVLLAALAVGLGKGVQRKSPGAALLWGAAAALAALIAGLPYFWRGAGRAIFIHSALSFALFSPLFFVLLYALHRAELLWARKRPSLWTLPSLLLMDASSHFVLSAFGVLLAEIYHEHSVLVFGLVLLSVLAALWIGKLLGLYDRQNREFRLIHRASEELSRLRPPEEVAEVVLRTFAGFHPPLWAGVYLIGSGGFPVLTVGQNLSLLKELASGLWDLGVRHFPSARGFLVTAPVVKSLASIPFEVEGEGRGLLLLASDEEGGVGEDHVRLATVLAAMLGTSLRNARLHQRVQEMAVTDELTGLYNHRYFYSALAEEMARARQAGTPLSLLYLDLDGFKAVNDTYGHLVGDALLQDVASLLRSSVRSSDVVARYGGDEFCLILPGASREKATEVLSRLREAFVSLQPGISFSAGIACFPEDGGTEDELVRVADERMYREKKTLH